MFSTSLPTIAPAVANVHIGSDACMSNVDDAKAYAPPGAGGVGKYANTLTLARCPPLITCGVACTDSLQSCAHAPGAMTVIQARPTKHFRMYDRMGLLYANMTDP